jgi:hypothetical protein
MSRREQREQLTNQEAYRRLALDQLRPLGRLIDEEPPARKRELVPLLADAMARPATVRRLHEALDATAKAAVREAAYDPAGRVDPARFKAKYGRLPNLSPEAGRSGSTRCHSREHPKINLSALAFRQAARSLHHSRSTLGAFYRRMRAWLGSPKAIEPTAHKLAGMVNALLTRGQAYVAQPMEGCERAYATAHARVARVRPGISGPGRRERRRTAVRIRLLPGPRPGPR